MKKHTPGPWSIKVGPSEYAIGTKYGIICDMRLPNEYGVPITEIDANADLISAAPELLAAAEAIIANWPAYWIILPSWPPEYKQRLDALKAAISKAKGGNHAT